MIADLVETVKPFLHQDIKLSYKIYTNESRNDEATITDWTLQWVLVKVITDAHPTISKTPSIDSPYANVVINASDLSGLDTTVDYLMQLWRIDSGNKYPLTGLGIFSPQKSPALS